MATRTFLISKDAYLQVSGAGWSGTDSSLPVGLITGPGVFRSYLQFTLDWTNVYQITSAVLHIRKYSDSGSARSKIRRCTATWSESSGPEPTTTATGEVDTGVMAAADAWKTFTVTTFVEAWAPVTVLKSGGGAGGAATNQGIRFVAFDETTTPTGALYYSRETTSDAYIVLTYTTNDPPSPPTINSPTASELISSQTPTISITHSDPNGDACASFDMQVDATTGAGVVPNWTGLAWSTTGDTSDLTNPITKVVGSSLTRGQWYALRARTADAANGNGAWSAIRYFKIAAAPTATVTTPGAAETAKVYYDAGTNTTPHFEVTWTYADTDGHAQASADIKVYADSAGSPGSLLHTHAHTGSTTTAKLTAYTPTNGTKYHISVTPTCSLTIAGAESTKNICRVRWARASYFYSLGLTPTGWGTPVVASTQPANSKITIEYAATASTVEPTTWYASFADITPNTYVWHRVTLTAWGSATPTGPSVESVTLKYTTAALTPDSWTLSAQVSIDEGTQFYGTQSLKVIQDNVGANRYAWQTVDVLPDTDYILSGRIKVTGNPTARVRVLAGDATTFLANSTAITATADWQTVQTDVFNSGGATELTIYCHTLDGAAGTAWFDALKLEASTIVTPWTPGFVSGGVTIDAGGLQVDASNGGVFRLRGSAGTAADEVTLGANGLEQVTSKASTMYQLAGRSAWLFDRIEGFMVDNPAAATSITGMGRFATGNTAGYLRAPIAGRAGRVVGIAWRVSTAITAGTMTLSAISGGTTTTVVALTSSSGTSGVSVLASPVAFSAANGMGISWATDAGYLPITADWAADLLVEYEPLA